jgi:hypothetical protein
VLPGKLTATVATHRFVTGGSYSVIEYLVPEEMMANVNVLGSIMIDGVLGE